MVYNITHLSSGLYLSAYTDEKEDTKQILNMHLLPEAYLPPIFFNKTSQKTHL